MVRDEIGLLAAVCGHGRSHSQRSPISVCLKMVDTSKIAIFTRKVIAVLGITRIIELIIQ